MWALAHHPSSSSQGWAADVSVNPLPKCSSSRAAASLFLPKGFGTLVQRRCLTKKHRNVAWAVKLNATLSLDSQSVFSYEATVIGAEAVIGARAVKEAAVALAQARADEVASTVALAEAIAQSADDLTRVARVNFWHGKLPSDIYSLPLEAARHSEIEQHKLFDALERMIMDDERQIIHNEISFLSSDFVHATQGSTFHEDEVSTTPSERKISFAARSLRHDKRVTKQMRASTKARKVAAAAFSAPSSGGDNSKKSPHGVAPFLVAYGRKRQKLLTATEEVHLSRKVQDLLGLEAIRSSLQEQLGRKPTLAEWAGAVDTTVRSLSSRLHEGREAKKRMIHSNFGLVALVANKYSTIGLSLEDLVQAGNIGLIRSCEKFDPGKGCKFLTYALHWIKQRILRTLENTRTVRVPNHLCWARARIQKAKLILFQKYQCRPGEKDVAKVLGTTVERLRVISRSFTICRSLDRLVGKDKNTCLKDYIADRTVEHPDSIIDKHFFKQDLNKLLEVLNEKEMAVVRHHFGLEGGKAMTLPAVGRKYSMSGERVRQIETIAMQKLQESDRSRC